MARKTTSSAATGKTAAAKTTVAPASAPVSTTPVRNTAIPPKSAAVAAPSAAPAKRAVPTHDTIALCAYYIWKSSGGSEFDNWIAAERRLNSI